MAALAKSASIEDCAEAAVGLDGRAIRKTVAAALKGLDALAG